MWFFRRDVGIAGELLILPKTSAVAPFLIAFYIDFTILTVDNF